MTSTEMFEWLDQFMIEAFIFQHVLAFDESRKFNQVRSARAARLIFVVDPELKTTDAVEAPSLAEAISKAARVRRELLDNSRPS